MNVVSGTTWVQEIVYLLKNNLNFEKAKEKVLEDRFPYLEYPYPGIHSVEKMPSPRLIKTHLPLDFLPDDVLSGKVIYITRNPKDTLVSYYHFARMLAFSSFEGSFEHFLRLFTKDERKCYKLYYKLFHICGHSNNNCLVCFNSGLRSILWPY